MKPASNQNKWELFTLAFWGACLGATISLGLEIFEIALGTDLFTDPAELEPFFTSSGMLALVVWLERSCSLVALGSVTAILMRSVIGEGWTDA